MKASGWFLILLLTLALVSCKVGRFIIYNFADINDYKKFPANEIQKGPSIFHFHEANIVIAPKSLTIAAQEYDSFESFLETTKTVAFLIIRNDSILYESYFSGYDTASVVPSFSMAKSVTSMLIGCAIDDGLIESVHDPVTKYVPELSENGFGDVTIRHLLQMTSGMKFNESYTNPFGDAATFYYGRNLRKACLKLETDIAPGEQFDYVSGSTQLLGFILDRVLEDQSISNYLEQKIWQPLGMEYDASWSLDRKNNGLEKTFCCLNARARDFAKLGRLYLHEGNWNGTQIISQEWVQESTRRDTKDGSINHYQYQWWLPSPQHDFVAQGILGQYVYVHPEKNIIIVRLGKKTGKYSWSPLFTSLAEGY